MPSSLIAPVAGAVIGGLFSDDSGAEAANASAAKAAEGQSRLANVQADIAQKEWDRYDRLYGPYEQMFVDESRGVGSISNQNKNAQQAAADVAAGFAGARERLNETPGLNPNSQAYLREANRVNLAEAASSAAAQTGARQQTRDRGRAATNDVVSLGKGLPASASTMLGSASSGLGSAARYYQSQASSERAQANQTASGLGRMAGGIMESKKFKEWFDKPDTAGTPPIVPSEGWRNTGSGMPSDFNFEEINGLV